MRLLMRVQDFWGGRERVEELEWMGGEVCFYGWGDILGCSLSLGLS